ncbi:MAG: tyrosine-type recombinase/integrase [Betaproteobacteria bacterium]|jgi:integrase|nr:tyrosine-type recombinase/integrase [Rubrivivax sp.]
MTQNPRVQRALDVAPPIESWAWPVVQQYFSVFDKYSDAEVKLDLDSPEWAVPVRGRTTWLRFPADPLGKLQRKLVILTQAEASPASIEKFGLSLINNWPLYERLLLQGPKEVRDSWDQEVLDIDVAKAGKTILKAAAVHEVGPWKPLHEAMVKSLDTRAKVSLQRQRSKIKRREQLLPVAQQAAITRILDHASEEESLEAADAEGLAALAIHYQHGMRPVQLLCLHLEHAHLVQDASGNWNCIISFHTAKQSDGNVYEEPRQIKPEWVPLIRALVRSATQSGRTRLFESTNTEALWGRLRSACRRRGFKVEFTANSLRHTATQQLADAGESRESIRRFLTHKQINAASVYQRGSLFQARLINSALGVSKLYGKILDLAEKTYVSVAEMLRAHEDLQVGGVVGEKLIAGIGLCRTGQPFCPYNPVTSCYGCKKFIPALNREAHLEAIVGMREQIVSFIRFKGDGSSPALRQLQGALAGAQQTLDEVDAIGKVG